MKRTEARDAVAVISAKQSLLADDWAWALLSTGKEIMAAHDPPSTSPERGLASVERPTKHFDARILVPKEYLKAGVGACLLHRRSSPKLIVYCVLLRAWVKEKRNAVLTKLIDIHSRNGGSA